MKAMLTNPPPNQGNAPGAHQPELPLFSLQFSSDPLFAPHLSALVGQLAERENMGALKGGQLALAAEEIVAHLAPLLPGLPIVATLFGTPTGLSLQIAFAEQRTSLRHFNLTSDRSEFLDEEKESSGLGLYIAARIVDNFGLELRSGKATITLRHDRPFGTVSPVAPSGPPLGTISLAPELTEDLLSLACAHTLACYDAESYEPIMASPARLAALIKHGEYEALIAVDAAGRAVGLLYWAFPSAKSARFFGPYLFGDQDSTAARLLCEGMLAKLGKSSVHAVFAGQATKQTPPELFECIRFPNTLSRPLLFRQIQEDAGSVIRCPECFRTVLSGLYDELFLVRDLVSAASPESLPATDSVLGVELDRARSKAVLRPLMAGADLRANISSHVAFLRQQGIRHVLARCDLYHGWQATTAGMLGEAGFVPIALEPEAGQGDLLLLEHHG